MARVFVDTNVLIYARDRREATKRDAARHWVAWLADRGMAVCNLQVLNEFARWLLVNEKTQPLAILREEVELLGNYGNTPLRAVDGELAWDVRRVLGYQWFDCLLVASAVNLGCRWFLSEDMSHGARYGDLTIIDPFQVDPTNFLNKN